MIQMIQVGNKSFTGKLVLNHKGLEMIREGGLKIQLKGTDWDEEIARVNRYEGYIIDSEVQYYPKL